MKTKIIPIFIFLVLTFSCSTAPEIPSFSLAESHIISASQASTMKKEYEQTISPLIKTLKSKDSIDYQPTQFAYIDLETLKSYVALLANVNEKNQEKISGVRIYFSSYPNQANDKNKYPGRETLFIAPTIKVAGTEMSGRYSNLENLPFTIKPDGEDKYVGEFKIATELLNEYDNRPSAPAVGVKDDDNTSLFLNDLQLTPPPK